MKITYNKKGSVRILSALIIVLGVLFAALIYTDTTFSEYFISDNAQATPLAEALTPTVQEDPLPLVTGTRIVDGTIEDADLDLNYAASAIQGGDALNSKLLQGHPASHFQKRIKGHCDDDEYVANIGNKGLECKKFKISEHHLVDSKDIADQAVESQHIKDGTITHEDLASDKKSLNKVTDGVLQIVDNQLCLNGDCISQWTKVTTPKIKSSVQLTDCKKSPQQKSGSDSKTCASYFGDDHVMVGMHLIKDNGYNRYHRLRCCQLTVTTTVE